MVRTAAAKKKVFFFEASQKSVRLVFFAHPSLKLGTNLLKQKCKVTKVVKLQTKNQTELMRDFNCVILDVCTGLSFTANE